MRECVRRFAEQVEHELRSNNGYWTSQDQEYLLRQLASHLASLNVVVLAGRSPEAVRTITCALASLAMMVSDNAGCLGQMHHGERCPS